MYLRIPELIAYIPALTQADNKSELEGIISQLIENVSNDFDSETQAPEQYYAQIVTDDFQSREYISNCSNFLHVHRFREVGGVGMRYNTVSSDRWRVINDQQIEVGYLNRGRQKVIVNAQWGFDKIPEDVKNAVLARVRIQLSHSSYSRLGFDEIAASELNMGQLNRDWNKTVEKWRHKNKFAYSGNGSYQVVDFVPSDALWFADDVLVFED